MVLVRKFKNDSATVIRVDHQCRNCSSIATTFIFKSELTMGSATRTCDCNIEKSIRHFTGDELQELLLSKPHAYDTDEFINHKRRIENACKAKIHEKLLWIFDADTIDDALILKCAAAAFAQRLKASPNVWAKIEYSNKDSKEQLQLHKYDSSNCVCGHEIGGHDDRGFCIVCRKFCDIK